MQLTVIHVDGSKKGQTETFQQAIVAIGRDPSNQLAFDAFQDTDVSSRHAQFVVAGDQLMITDLNSKNGTFVNGNKVSGQAPVPDGAIVQFGDKGPKVQISFRAVATGPSKKTQMIQDLQGALAGQQAAAAKQAASARMTSMCMVLGVVLVGVLAAGGYFVWSSMQAKKAAIARIDSAKEKLAALKTEAEAAKAGELAKPELEKAVQSEKDAAAADSAGKKGDAATMFEAAVAGYQLAISKAKEATIEGLKNALAGKVGEAKGAEVQANTKREEEIKKAETERLAAAERETAELKRKLESQKTAQDMTPLIQAALASTKEKQVQLALDKVQEQLKAGPNDDFTKWQGQLKARLDEIRTLPAKLDEAAKARKASVVAIQATSYALPKSQNEKTTQIREFLMSVSGTGFFVGKDKIATSKQLVEPWKFDAQALALKQKWDEKGYQVHTRIDIAQLDSSGVFVPFATSNPELDDPTVSIGSTGAESYLDAPEKVVVNFQGADVAVDVKVHRRDASNVATLVLKNGAAQPFALAAADSTRTGDLVIALGVRTGGPDAKSPDQTMLYSQRTEVLVAGSKPIVNVGGYSTWSGGPVLNTKGEVVGLIIDVNSDKMTILGPEGIKDASAKN